MERVGGRKLDDFFGENDERIVCLRVNFMENYDLVLIEGEIFSKS